MGQLTISWSQLKNHTECRRKSHLLRTGKRSSVTDIRQFFHGTVCDRLMREYLEDTDNQYPGFMAEAAERIMDREEQEARESGDGIVKWRNKDDRKEVLAFCQELCNNFEPILEKHVLPRKHQAAVRFRAPIRIPGLDGKPAVVRLIGEIDILTWDLDYQNIEVYDLKATKNDQYWRSVIGQTVFYDLAMFATHGTWTQRVGLFQPMCKKKVIDYTVTDQMRRELMQRIINMAHDVWKKDIALRPDTTKCGFCIVKHACERFESKDGRIVLGKPGVSIDELMRDL